jgi:spermidine synthase
MAAKKPGPVSHPKKSASVIQSRLFWLASIVFFVSGGTGLVYQVVWFKRFSHVWGSSSLAFAAVAGSFLFGLGLGAYLLGRWADRASVPLRWYGACELLIGLLALVIPLEIASLVDASVGLYARIPEQPFLRYLVQFAITLLVVGPPCVLMGGTLPLLIRQLTARDGSLDQATAWLYAINTFGAATGCYLAGFHLLPSFGLLWTNNFAAATNIAIGVVSLVASNSAQRLAVGRTAPGRSTADSAPMPAWSPKLAGLYLATALTGCGALMLEMTWTRQLAIVLGGSTYAYTATLFVVLLGIGLGSLIFHAFLRGMASSQILPVAVVGIVVLGTAAGAAVVPSLTRWVAPIAIRDFRGEQLGNGLVCVTASAMLEFLPAVGMGILFPLFVHMTRASAAKVGSAVGNIYAWNTMGSIAGASLTAALLFPRIGTSGAVALATLMYVVALLAVMPWRGTLNVAKVAAAAAVGAAAVAFVARPMDPRLTNAGLYLYGNIIGEDQQKYLAVVKTLYFREGASSNVFVARKFPRSVTLRVNGKVDASNGPDMATQTGMAYFPRILKPDAKEVFVIGFGSGCTAGRNLLFPDTHVTCCELEPAVYAASEFFGDINGRPHEKTRSALLAKNATLPPEQRLSEKQIDQQARFSMIFGDGRTALQGSPNKFDIIASEPSNPWIAGISNLFTREFFRAAREHLTEGGVLAQWIQTYNFTLSDYLMIVRTMRSEFPYCGIVELVGGTDTLLLASMKPLLPDPKQLAELQKVVEASPMMKADFENWFGSTDLRLVVLSSYTLGTEQLDGLLARDHSRALNTDLHLQLEFDAPLHLFRKADPKESAVTAFHRAGGDRWTTQLARHLGMDPTTIDFCLTMGNHQYVEANHYAMLDAAAFGSYYLDKSSRFYKRALELDPKHAEAQRQLKRVELRRDTKTDPEIKLRKLIQLDPNDAIAHAQLATLLLNKLQRIEAAEHYREALRLHPDLSLETRTYTWANNLAWLLATSPEEEVRKGNNQEALRWAELACKIANDTDPSVIDTLAAALANVGRFDDAIRESKRVIKLAPYYTTFVEDVENRIKLYEASRPFREG